MKTIFLTSMFFTAVLLAEDKKFDDTVPSTGRPAHFASETLVKDLQALSESLQTSIDKGKEVPKKTIDEVRKKVDALYADWSKKKEKTKDETAEESKPREPAYELLDSLQGLFRQMGKNVNNEMDQTLKKLSKMREDEPKKED